MFGNFANQYDLRTELANCCNKIGKVYLAEYKPTHEIVALKKFQLDKATETENSLIKEEMLKMRNFNHPNIQSIYTTFINNFEMYVVQPIMSFCSCRDAMSNYFRTGFPEIVVCFILRDILYALDYLHKRGYIHRSIRSSHILLHEYKAVLSGFRECTNVIAHGERARTLHDLPANSLKSLNWLAPEVLEQNLVGYTEKSDIYSVGITTCELANGLEPFADMPTTFMFTEKIHGHQPALLDNSTCPEELITQTIDDSGVTDSFAAIQTHQIYGQRQLSDPFHKFSELCMLRNPNDRPTAFQLLGHGFFKQCKNQSFFESLYANGVDNVPDCAKLKDPNIKITLAIGDMQLEDTFEWDF